MGANSNIYSLDKLLEGMDQEGAMEQYIHIEPIGKEQFWEGE